MGTNYYLHESPCPACGRSDDPLHIGKSSAGWVFSLHVMPGDGINDLPDWEARWGQPGRVIRDEYGRDVTPSEMRAIIADRTGSDRAVAPDPNWMRENRAEPGPNNLMRHRVGTWGCVAHGRGTWDCFDNEFS